MTGAPVIARAAVVACARTWIRTPYQHQARLKGIGVDCAGLVIVVARELGLCEPDFDVIGYSRQPDGSLLDHCARLMSAIPLADMLPGDVVAMSVNLSQPNHVGILGDYVHGGLSLIHALQARTGRGKVLEQSMASSTLARVAAAYRLKGVV